MIAVAQSKRYENFRAGYSSNKRSINVPPNIRSIQPRLEHENASDDVKGLGKKKVPTSTQRPTRSTNVPIVYSRISSPLEQRHELQQGDVIFVGKYSTKFGAGLNRLTRVAHLADINAMLSNPSNFILEEDLCVESLLNARRAMSREYADLANHLTSERDSMLRSNGKRAWFSLEIDRYIDLVRERRSCIDAAIEEAERSNLNGSDTTVYPDMDWAYVSVFRNWTVDGVLYGVESGRELIDLLVPCSSNSDQLVNVCLQGPCPTRNQKLTKVPQFFDCAVRAGEFLYACIVAVPGDKVWKYKIGLVSSRQANELMDSDFPNHVATVTPGGVSSEFTKADLMYTVAAWKLGRVIDTRLVTGSHARLMLDVEISFVDRLHLFRHLIASDQDVTMTRLACKCVTKQALTKTITETSRSTNLLPLVVAPEESPITRVDRDSVPDKTPIVGQDSVADEELPSPAPAAYPLVLSTRTTVTPTTESPNDEILYKIGSAAVEFITNTADNVISTKQLSLGWLKEPNANFEEFNNLEISLAVHTFFRGALVSKPREYQSAYFQNAMFLTAFVNAVDRFMLEAPGKIIKEYNDFCGVLSLMKDNGLAHALCRALDDATLNGKKRFPYKFRPSGSNVNLMSFELPPQEGGELTLNGVLDSKRLLDMAPGSDILEKTEYFSCSLNFLFDLPLDTQWSAADIGIAWVRPTSDKESWNMHSEARSNYISDVAISAQVQDTGLSSANTILLVILFGILYFMAIAPHTLQKLANETKGIQLPSRLLQSGTKASRIDEANSLGIQELVESYTDSLSLNEQAALTVYRKNPLIDQRSGPPPSNTDKNSLQAMQKLAESEPTIVDVNKQNNALQKLQRALYNAAVLSVASVAGTFVGLTLAID